MVHVAGHVGGGNIVAHVMVEVVSLSGGIMAGVVEAGVVVDWCHCGWRHCGWCHSGSFLIVIAQVPCVEPVGELMP